MGARSGWLRRCWRGADAVGLRKWVAEIAVRDIATVATSATEKRETDDLSQLSQLSQGVKVPEPGVGHAELSQLSQPLGSFTGSGAAREAIDERAAIGAAGLTKDDPEPAGWRGAGLDLGDLRPCIWCRDLALSGRCMAAARGELRAARDYSPPIPGQPQRCIGYSPPADDPDLRPGRERWPELVETQVRRVAGNLVEPPATRSGSREVV